MRKLAFHLIVAIVCASPSLTAWAQSSAPPRLGPHTRGPSAAAHATAPPAATKPATTVRPQSASGAHVVRAQKAQDPKQTTLRVGLAGSEPFVLQGPTPEGFVFDVWKDLARRVGARFSARRYESVHDLLSNLKRGAIDVAIGPISITAERSKHVDFSQPYFTVNFGLLVNANPPSRWDAIRPLVSRAFIVGIGILFTVLFLVANLIWLVERRRNPEHFPRPYLRGIGNGMWFAVVTMTTVGYGDRAPLTRLGRLISALWMLIAMVTASSLTAGIATALTLSQIDRHEISTMAQLRGHRVAVVHGTPAVNLARRVGANVVIVKRKEKGIELVRDKTADAFIYEYPILKHYLAKHPTPKLVVHQSKINGDQYGFAVARGNALRAHLDVALLEMRETMTLRRIAQRWKIHMK